MDVNNWDSASLALHNMNGSLEVDYRLAISNELWYDKKSSYIIWKCKNCTTKKTITVNKGEEDEKEKEVEVPTCSKREDITIFDQRCNGIVEICTGSKTRQMWECPKCETVQPVANVEAEMLKHTEPFYRGCIYSQPIKPITGLMRRRGAYPEQMIKWCTAFSIELEHQLAIYRFEYISQHGHDMADSIDDYKDKGGSN